MYVSAEYNLSTPVCMRTGDDEEPRAGEVDPEFMDEARTRYRLVSHAHHDPKQVVAALTQVAFYLGGRRPDVEVTPRGVVVALRYDADTPHEAMKDALLLFLGPLGVHPGDLGAGLDGIGRLEDHVAGKVRRKGGEIVGKKITILVPAEGWAATANGVWVQESEKHRKERKHSEEKQLILNEKEARRVDRQKRQEALAKRMQEALRERDEAREAKAAAERAVMLAAVEALARGEAPPVPEAPKPIEPAVTPPLAPIAPPPAALPAAMPPAPAAAAPAPTPTRAGRGPRKVQDAAGRWRWAVGAKKGQYAPAPRRAPRPAPTPAPAPTPKPTPKPAQSPAKVATKKATAKKPIAKKVVAKATRPTRPTTLAKRGAAPKAQRPTPIKPSAPAKKKKAPPPRRGVPRKTQDARGLWRWAVGPQKGQYTTPPKRRR